MSAQPSQSAVKIAPCTCMHVQLCMKIISCLFQTFQGDAKTVKLLDILDKADDARLPLFIQALRETGQMDVVELLGFAGEQSITTD